jgi:HK97 family phage major capsid protein
MLDEQKFAAALAERDKAVLDRLEAIDKKSGDRFDEMQERIEEIEARKSTPGKTGGDGETAESREHMKLFDAWIRKPKHPETNRKLSEFETQAKSVSIATPSAGGYAVPEEIGRRIREMQIKLSPVRRLVNVGRAGTSDIKRLIDIGGAEGGWRSESGSVTETDTPLLREVAPTGGEIYAYPKASNWSLEDVFFDVSKWLVRSCSRRFAQLEGAAVISGDGSNKPTGMLNTTPVTTADDATVKRAAAAYQYILGGDNSPAGPDGDALIDLVYALNSEYRSGAAWAMNSNTVGAIRKLKASGTGDYIFQPSLQAGQPALLLGYPVEVWEQMPDPVGGAFPIAFGNFDEGYELIDRGDLHITVDEVTTPGMTKFYVRRRVYGAPMNNDAVKFLKLL